MIKSALLLPLVCAMGFAGDGFRPLRVDMKQRNPNSGIQFRSEALPGRVVRGCQACAAGNIRINILK